MVTWAVAKYRPGRHVDTPPWPDCAHGDHSPDNVKFPDISLKFATLLRSTRHVKCYSYTSVTVSGGGRNATVQWTETIYLTFKTQQTPTKYLYGDEYAACNKQFIGNFSLTRFFPWQFPDISLIFSKIPDISLTAVKFPRWHFQVFQTSGHPVCCTHCSLFSIVANLLGHHIVQHCSSLTQQRCCRQQYRYEQFRQSAVFARDTEHAYDSYTPWWWLQPDSRSADDQGLFYHA